MSDYAIEARGLYKAYGSVVALNGVDLTVERGTVFALLGPNGAGKTTLAEVLEGHRRPDRGDARVLGFDPSLGEREFRARIGIVLQETGVEPYLSVEEVVDLFRGYYPHPRPRDEVIELVGLADQRRSRVSRLSGGQQRRLDVAVGLAGDPDLLFLDEPTTGFDPAARRGAWEMVRGLQSLGKTIFLTTHYMEEAEYLAGDVAIISKGTIVARGSPSSLISEERDSVIHFRVATGTEGLLDGLEGAHIAADGSVSLSTSQPTQALYALTSRALENGIELTELSVSRARLEDVYLRLVGATDGEA